MQTTAPQVGDRFGEAILRALREEVAKIAEEEGAKAAERVHQRTRERVNEIAVGLFNNFSLERMGPDLVIRVLHEDRR